jgi:phospholipid/cholesterol/gamma-HCH transport system substrate-binding protein
MDAKKEQALVGLFVLIASGILLATIFSISGAFGTSDATYRTFFKFAAGIEPGATVRMGGIKAGRVEKLQVDPQDPTRIEMTFSLKPGMTVKQDSLAKISSLGALGDNYLEVTLGTATAAPLPPGSVVPSKEFFGIADLSDALAELRPEIKKLAENLNKRVEELQVTVARVNDLVNDQNRGNVAASIGNVRGMLEENRPKLKATMTNIETSTAKIPALIDDFKKTVKQTDETLAKIDAMIGENRPDIRASIQELRKTLVHTSEVVAQMDRTLGYNAENIDEILENIRLTTENLKQFTDTIKARPYTLIRATQAPERKPGDPPKP